MDRKRLVSLLAALCLIALSHSYCAELPGKEEPKVDERQLKDWVGRLANDDFETRQEAEKSLTGLTVDAVAPLKTLLAVQKDDEAILRLKRVIYRLSHPRWFHELEAAKKEAANSGRPILIFSTIGESDGFA
jgi:hypothetical protein